MQLATSEQAQAPIVMLDHRAVGGVATYEAPKMRAWAATISAGYKENNKPVVVRDGKIRLHEDMGEAPGIKSVLAKNDHRFLSITMLDDDINKCISQLFCSYGTTKIFGDQNSLTIMKMDGEVQKRKVVLAGTQDFEDAKAFCKVSTFVPFALAEWNGNDPKVIFLDGFAPYRLRFTSLNSARAFVDSLLAIKQLTGGKLMGVPLHLSMVYQDKMTPQLERRKVPIWNVKLKHPEGIALGAREISHILTAGIKDAAQMALPPTISALPPASIEAMYVADEALEVDEETGVVENSRSVKTAIEGTSPETRRADYFRATQNTPYTEDAGRQQLVQRMSDQAGVMIDAPSLNLLTQLATDSEWLICCEVMCKAAAEFHGTETPKEAKPVVDEEAPFADLEVPATEETKPVEASPKTPANYLHLDRKPTKSEVAKALAFRGETLTDEQCAVLDKESGGIDTSFVLLEAQRRGFRTIAEMLQMIGVEPTEQGALL